MKLTTFYRQTSQDSKRLAANSVWLLLARLSSQMLVFLFLILVARSLGAAGLGQYAFISALVYLANIATTFGTDTYLIRQVAGGHSPSEASLGAVLYLQLSLSILFIAVIALTPGDLPGKTQETVHSLKAFAFALVPLAFSTVFSAVLRGRQRMDLYLLANLFPALIQLAGAAFVLTQGGGLLTLAWVVVLAQGLGAVYSFRLSKRLLPGLNLFRRVSLSRIAELIVKSWPLALLAGLGIAYQRLGTLLLSSFTGDAATGWFSAAGRITEGFKIIHIALLGSLFPMLIHFSQPDNRGNQPVGRLEGSRFLRNAYGLLMAYVLLIVFSVTILAKPIITFSFGGSFEPSGDALRLLILSLIPYTYTALVSLELVAKGAERWVLLGLGVTMAAALPLNLVLISRFGLIGACWSTVASELIQAQVLFILRGRTQHKDRRSRRTNDQGGRK